MRLMYCQGQLYSANYGSGTWTVLALDSSGALGGVLRHEQFPGPGLNCTRCGVNLPLLTRR